MTSADDILAELDLTIAVRQLEIKVAIPSNSEQGALSDSQQ